MSNSSKPKIAKFAKLSPEHVDRLMDQTTEIQGQSRGSDTMEDGLSESASYYSYGVHHPGHLIPQPFSLDGVTLIYTFDTPNILEDRDLVQKKLVKMLPSETKKGHLCLDMAFDLQLPEGSRALAFIQPDKVALTVTSNLNRIAIEDLDRGGLIDRQVLERMAFYLPKHSGEKFNHLHWDCLLTATKFSGLTDYREYQFDLLEKLNQDCQELIQSVLKTIEYELSVEHGVEIRRLEFTQDLVSKVRWNQAHANITSAIEENLLGARPTIAGLGSSRRSRRGTIIHGADPFESEKKAKSPEARKRTIVAGSRLYFKDFKQYRSFEDQNSYHTAIFNDLHKYSWRYSIAARSYPISKTQNVHRIDARQISTSKVPPGVKIATHARKMLQNVEHFLLSEHQLRTIRPRRDETAMGLLETVLDMANIPRKKELRLLKGKVVKLTRAEAIRLRKVIVTLESGVTEKPKVKSTTKSTGKRNQRKQFYINAQLMSKYQILFASSMDLSAGEDQDYFDCPQPENRIGKLTEYIREAVKRGFTKQQYIRKEINRSHPGFLQSDITPYNFKKQQGLVLDSMNIKRKRRKAKVFK